MLRLSPFFFLPQVKKGDDETTEEYSRTYEMPDGVSGLETEKLKSFSEKDGVLTVELPFAAIKKA